MTSFPLMAKMMINVEMMMETMKKRREQRQQHQRQHQHQQPGNRNGDCDNGKRRKTVPKSIIKTNKDGVMMVTGWWQRNEKKKIINVYKQNDK